MNENYQDKTGSKLMTTEDERLWLKKERPPRWTSSFGKTFRDWLQLIGVLLIPLVVAGATILFSAQQSQLAQQQHIAEQQRALDQQQAAILQTYIDNIQDLLLNHNLLESKPFDSVATLARARTLTALQGLDPERKVRLLIFLYDTKLIGWMDADNKWHAPSLDLGGPLLDKANLRGLDLSGTYFAGIYLTSVDLSDAHLARAQLNDSMLIGAIFDHTDLSGATLVRANLTVAPLYGANLRGADLIQADLRGADLRGADLRGAILYEADLRDAQNLTQEQLDQVYTCEGATLPKGLTCNRTPSH